MSSVPPVDPEVNPVNNLPVVPETARRIPSADKLLTPAEVAAMFNVAPKTVARWHQTGKVSAIRTPGGHRRFHAREIHELLGDV